MIWPNLLQGASRVAVSFEYSKKYGVTTKIAQAGYEVAARKG